METHKTSKSLRAVPAYQNIDTPNGQKEIKFLISTDRVNNIVFLRIDEVDEVPV